MDAKERLFNALDKAWFPGGGAASGHRPELGEHRELHVTSWTTPPSGKLHLHFSGRVRGE